MYKPNESIGGIPTFYGVYMSMKQEVMSYGGRGWNAETERQYDQTVLNHVLPYLDQENKHIGELTIANYDKAMKKLLKAGKNGPDGPFEPWEKGGVPEKANYLMRAVVWTAARHDLCIDCFEEVKDRGSLDKNKSEPREKTKIPKCFSILQEQLIVKYLLKVFFSSGSVAGLLLQFALGLRNNEACGVNFGYIREYKNYPGHYYLIVPQTTDLGSSTVKILGKTKNSGRKVPLSKPMAILFRKLFDRRSYSAKAMGYAGMMEDLPIACKRKPWLRCSSDDLSYAAKEMFIKIGMRKDDIIALNYELLEEAQVAREELEEDEFKEIESNPTAYLLRRNFATHLARLMLTDREIWYVIGHKIEDPYVQRKSFNDEKLLFALKRKLDQRPILNHIDLEQHLDLVPGGVVELEGSKRIILRIPIEKAGSIDISVVANEPGDEIKIRTIPELTAGEIKAYFKAYPVSLPIEPSRIINGTRMYQEAYRKAGVKDLCSFSD